jgi:hypothetical protein
MSTAMNLLDGLCWSSKAVTSCWNIDPPSQGLVRLSEAMLVHVVVPQTHVSNSFQLHFEW